MIYFDNASTTPPMQALRDLEIPFGNPSSPHGLGILAERAIADSRRQIADILSCHPSDVAFTSGGTESNNLAIIGFALANRRNSVKILAQSWAHPSILEPLRYVDSEGLAEVEILSAPLSKSMASKLTAEENLVLISQMNHETGDIFDVAGLAADFRRKNPHITVHVDGVQGFCKMPMDLYNVDMYSFSAHKIHGPAGVGGLMVRNTRLMPLLYGGGQERYYRSGTENVEGIIKMAYVIKNLHESQSAYHSQMCEIKSELSKIQDELPGVHVNCIGENTSPYILNLSFDGIKGEILVHLLSEKKIYASMGAACRSRKKEVSSLEAMGFTKERAQSAVRFSFSHMNTVAEACQVREAVAASVAQLRRVLGYRD